MDNVHEMQTIAISPDGMEDVQIRMLFPFPHGPHQQSCSHGGDTTELLGWVPSQRVSRHFSISFTPLPHSFARPLPLEATYSLQLLLAYLL